MSPESFEGALSIYGDQYSLGVVMYEMLTGRIPFDDVGAIEVYRKHLSEIPRNPRKYRKEIPEELEKIILKSLEKDIHDRFYDMEEMIKALCAVQQKL